MSRRRASPLALGTPGVMIIPLPAPTRGGNLADGEPWAKAEGSNTRFTFAYGQMYEAPPLGYSQLRALAEHFGTEKIDTEPFSRGGCETCDHGGSYGHTIIVEGVTKNLPFP